MAGGIIATTTRCRPNGTKPYWPAVQCRLLDRPRARRSARPPAALQTTTTDADRRRTPTTVTILPPTLCVGGPVIITRRWRAYLRLAAGHTEIGTVSLPASSSQQVNPCKWNSSLTDRCTSTAANVQWPRFKRSPAVAGWQSQLFRIYVRNEKNH